MKIKIILPVLILLASGCADNTVGPEEYGEGDDYAIYKIVINSVIPENNLLIVLNDSTGCQRYDSSYVQYFLKQIPEMNAETINNLVAVNIQKVKLKKIPGINSIFGSEFDVRRNKVFVTLSRVGYNNNVTQAVITIAAVYGPLAGTGTLVYLERIGNEWIIKRKILVWIS